MILNEKKPTEYAAKEENLRDEHEVDVQRAFGSLRSLHRWPSHFATDRMGQVAPEAFCSILLVEQALARALQAAFFFC